MTEKSTDFSDNASSSAGAMFDDSLRQKSKSSLGWTVTKALSDQVFSLVIFIMLARLLTKEEIGIFAMVYVFSEVGRILATGGLVQLIARAKKIDNLQINTIFWTNMGIAFVYVGLIWVIAPLLAALLNQPGLTDPLRILSLALPINALGASHFALRLREFGHKTVAVRSILAGIIGGTTAVVAAMSGWGIWSLVVQRCVTEAVSTILAWTSYRWVPRLQFDWMQAKQNFAFTSNLTIAQLIFLMLVRVQDLLIGASLGAAAVGIYRVAWRSTEMFAAAAIQPFSAVGLQIYSRLQDNPVAMKQAYKAMLGVCAGLSFPALVGFGVIAPDLVPLVFGWKWQAAGELAQVFAFMAIPYTLNFFASPVLSAVGNSHRQRTLAITQLVVTLTLTLIALPYGLTAVAIAYVVRSYLTLPLQIYFLKEASGIGSRTTFDAVKAPFLASTLMGVLLWTTLEIFADDQTLSWVKLIGAITAAALFYIAILLAISSTYRRFIADVLPPKELSPHA
ncbi:lipopolysaccharide biosynthesis protein [Parasphingorhabdus cellanae]|uniref:Lipopolysaccharide biosynthesis protein n=1 Tax=Parasphingorhabdus cellanae TaxID=2806553 RepID=A0ABX7T2W1_9SPHN|nr:lipopolysaccharide biosynthesis protein [Parasphingorhabdus cellanae]QTD55293.1 lipopolysaccharide biosynthesis protein [Parasphingorhabdus cellanae]